MKKIPGYTIENILGAGKFGYVYLAKENKKKRFIALKEKKRFAKRSIEEEMWFENEIKILDQMKVLDEKTGAWPENIIKYYEGWNDYEEQYISFEYCKGGALRYLIDGYKNKNESIPEEFILSFLSQMIAGISALHLNGFVHRAIKPHNILIFEKQIMKIAGFGICTFDDLPVEKLEIPILQPTLKKHNYVSPQVEMEKPYGAKCDIWSLGSILLEMMSQKNRLSLFAEIKSLYLQNKQEEINKLCKLKSYSQELCDIVCLMLQIDEKQRIGISSLNKLHFLQVK